MACISKRVKSFFNRQRVELESWNFLENGGLLMEKLISLSNGRRDDIHIRRFTIPEITNLTNNFEELFRNCGHYKLFKGNLDGRPILVQIYEEEKGFPSDHRDVAFATAISALMSHLKYNLKLIGCCTDYELPEYVFLHPRTRNAWGIVYEFTGTATTLDDLLGEDQSSSLSWGNRVKIARDIASMVVYLHTSFPLPIIHRDLKSYNVLIDQNGDAKLFDFSLSIEVPRGESEVETDLVSGTLGFLDPEYYRTNRVTTKSDVYSFGVILQMLLTGKPFYWNEEGNEVGMTIHQYIKQFLDGDAKLIDRNIAQGVEMDEFRAVKDLALCCTQDIPDNRPEMIDVARRLHEIEKLVNKPSCRI